MKNDRGKDLHSIEKTVNKLHNQATYTPVLTNLAGHNFKKRLTSDLYPHKDKINAVCWNKNKKFSEQLIAIDSSGLMNVWEPKGTKVIDSIKASSNTWLTSVDVEKSEGKLVAIGTLDNKILVFEINKGNLYYKCMHFQE